MDLNGLPCLASCRSQRRQPVRRLSQEAVKWILGRRDEALAGLDGHKIAGALGIEASTLRKAFEQDLHIGIDDYILREKIYRALFAIDRGMAVSSRELSQKLGFSKCENFVRAFKRMVLITPDRYIELKKKIEFLVVKGGRRRRTLLISLETV
jgi:AraC-like DNA-binding protein